MRVEAGGKPIAGEQKIYKEVDGEVELDQVIPGNHELADIYSKLHVADWNGDGKLDLLIGNFWSSRDRKSGGNVWVFLRK